MRTAVCVSTIYFILRLRINDNFGMIAENLTGWMFQETFIYYVHKNISV